MGVDPSLTETLIVSAATLGAGYIGGRLQAGAGERKNIEVAKADAEKARAEADAKMAALDAEAQRLRDEAAEQREQKRSDAHARLLAAHDGLLSVYAGPSYYERQVRDARTVFAEAYSAVAVHGTDHSREAAEQLRLAWNPRVAGVMMGPDSNGWRADVDKARDAFVRSFRGDPYAYRTSVSAPDTPPRISG